MKEEIIEFIRSRGRSGDFNELALRTFALQYETSSVYRRFCRARNKTPDDLRTWTDIPALPADAFKGGLGETDCPAPYVFLSSGTTRGTNASSRHELSDLETYHASSMAHFSDMVLPDEPQPLLILVLGPTAPTHPHSSLGRMLSWATELADGATATVAFDAQGNVDLDRAIEWLTRRADGIEPALLLGLSSSFTALFARLRDKRLRLRLPADSRLVDTGGRKGTHPVLSARGLIKAAWTYLHIPGYCCVNEYGMTEMLSQFYDDCLLNRFRGRLSKRAKTGPAWVRTTIVDPATLEPVPAGRMGILRHLDLANWQSLSSIQTLDLAREAGAGFEVLGRVPMAEARGCSQLMRSLAD